MRNIKQTVLKVCGGGVGGVDVVVGVVGGDVTHGGGGGGDVTPGDSSAHQADKKVYGAHNWLGLSVIMRFGYVSQ